MPLGTCETFVQARQVDHRVGPPAIVVSLREAHEDVRSAVVGLDLVGVERLLGRVRILDPLRLGEMQDVLRHRGHDVAHAASEAAVVLPVLAPHWIPEGQILRIERSLPLDRLRAHRGEAEPIRGLEHVQPMRLAAHDDDLVLLVGWAVRIGIHERGRVCRAAVDLCNKLGRHDDVVLRRTIELEDAQRRLTPVEPVVALRVAQHPRVWLPRLGWLAAVLVVAPTVVHPVEIAVLEHRLIPARIPAPRLVRAQHHFSAHWPMQLQSRLPAHAVDEELVHE